MAGHSSTNTPASEATSGLWPCADQLRTPSDAKRIAFAALRQSDLDAVCAVEKSAYAHPWSRKHFADSLAAGYVAVALWGDMNEEGNAPRGLGHPMLLGYLVAMPGVDEVHLLNITVAPPHQRQGWGRCLLDALCLWARGQRAQWLWLEVRVGNHPALKMYQAYGFQQVGLRKAYYPAGAFEREDAVVMSLNLVAHAAHPPSP